MLGEAIAGTAVGASALMAYAVRGRSSSLLGPSVCRGDASRKAVALTFDDGPTPATSALLEVLSSYKVPATFFQCGVNVRNSPEAARNVVREGHEIGNHSDTHLCLSFRSASTIQTEFQRAQETIEDVLGVSPRLLRAPFGVRWFGFRQTQERLQLLGVMWTAIGLDWKLPPARITSRLRAAACNGAIFCLHDGRELQRSPDIGATVEAVRRLIPELREQGYTFETVSQILCPKN